MELICHTVTRATQLEAKLQRWSEAGLIDAQSAARILVFERGQERRASLRWPVILAMVGESFSWQELRYSLRRTGTSFPPRCVFLLCY